MIKKITITLCAIIIGLSTIFINQSTVKAEEVGNINIIEYPTIPIIYPDTYGTEQGLTKKGINIKEIKSVKALYITGTMEKDQTTSLYIQFTTSIDVMLNSVYSVYIYSTCENNNVRIYSNEVHTYGEGYFTNRFYKFTAPRDKVSFLIEFAPNYTENAYEGYYTFMIWQGDWELNAEIVNSMSYQIGYNEGKIQGYENGYNKGSTDGYTKGQQNAIESINNANYLNKYFFNSNSEAVGKVYETKYSNPDDTILGSFNLGVSKDNGLTFINAKEYYTNYTPQSYNYIEINTVNEEFTYGYNQLIFNGLPIGTLIHLELKFIAKNEYTDISYAIDSNGKLHYLHGGQQGYVPNTCLNSIRINGFIGYNFETDKEYKPLEDATFFNLKDYANFSVTLPEDFTNKSLYENGYNNAKSEYYNKWYIGRYQQGYNEGTSNAGNYTFLSLMGSVIDAPIKAISNMLNFEILGFNMMQFFYAIITVCIIVTIVKLLL